MKKFAGFVSVLALVAGLGWPVPQAAAESLYDAMARAYMGNPTLRAARAEQRATDESVAQAMSGWRPTVTANAAIGRQHTDTVPAGSSTEIESTTTPGSLSISLAQPVFRGFKTVNGVKAAKAAVAAGQQGLLATEQNVLFQVVSAYMDVVRYRSVVGLRAKNVSVLQEQLRAAQARFNVGEVTRTDVAQARARVAAAQAAQTGSEARLAAAVASYAKLVGAAPGSLTYPKLPRLPKSLDAALSTASETNPGILAAALVEEAAVHQVEVAKGDLLPTIALKADASASDALNLKGGEQRSASIMGVISVPLYDGGYTYSKVRAAKQTASQKRIQVIEANRAVREGVSVAWNSVFAARQMISAAGSQISAARLALEGVRQEYAAGSRTTLDVLNAQAELYDAQISLVNAQHDEVVAAYQLVANMGHLTADHLGLRVDIYDPNGNYSRVRKKAFGTDVETVE
jgi:TolC family type I secretion outer membrane protein